MKIFFPLPCWNLLAFIYVPMPWILLYRDRNGDRVEDGDRDKEFKGFSVASPDFLLHN